MVQVSSQSTVNKIEMRLRGKGRGSIVFQQDYADCGTPSAVKSTFHRMYTDGMLVRLAHGIYYYPKEDKEYGLGIIYPSVEDIAQAIAKRDKANIVPMGAYALNRLGLSTQRVFKIQKNICAVLRTNSIASVASLQGAPRGHLAEVWGEAL